MSRRDIVILVGRALAVIQFVTAFMECSYLPMYLMEMVHHAREVGSVANTAVGQYYFALDRVETISLIVRIAGLLICGIILWNCGPWLERKLLPNRDAAQAGTAASA